MVGTCLKESGIGLMGVRYVEGVEQRNGFLDVAAVAKHSQPVENISGFRVDGGRGKNGGG